MNASVSSWSNPESLSALSDDTLHASVRALVGRSNRVLAALLAHLAEVEARGIHRDHACASLYTYCIYELRFAEDAAYKRSRAATIARRFPVILDMVAAGELHLTGVVMLAPHLTDENQGDLLARSKHRTKREIAKLLAEIAPGADVPSLVVPLVAVTSPGVGAPPSWARMVAGLTGWVRELPPGDAPRDWMAAENDGADEPGDAPERHDEPGDAPERHDEPSDAPERRLPTPAPPAVPRRYRVQFSAGQEYVDLLEEARDLLAHELPSRDLEQVQLRAMRALVADLRRRKCAATARPAPIEAETRAVPESEAPLRSGASSGRSIPAAIRRAVWQRDATRCAFVDDRGTRCGETAALEIHHRQPFARGGPATLDNLELRCRAHNLLAAEHDFGRAAIELHRRHE